MTNSVSSATEREVLIEREFDAPRELVFDAWIDPGRLVRWYAPRGCTVQFRTFEPRQGGTFHSCIRSSEGHECWCIGAFCEIARPERLVYTLAISDEDGRAVDPTQVGMDPDWPRETILTVTFAEQNGKTKLTLRQTVSESLAKKTGAHPSWLQMLDRLDELLVRV
jgi:uncharacterized protein YndB with AHSA1/START domain